MTIRPLHDRILAKRVSELDKTSGGLFIPDNAREKPLEAVVVSDDILAVFEEDAP